MKSLNSLHTCSTRSCISSFFRSIPALSILIFNFSLLFTFRAFFGFFVHGVIITNLNYSNVNLKMKINLFNLQIQGMLIAEKKESTNNIYTLMDKSLRKNFSNGSGPCPCQPYGGRAGTAPLRRRGERGRNLSGCPRRGQERNGGIWP